MAMIPRAARAACPDERDEILCEPFGGVLLPAVTGNALVTPGSGAFAGGGLELVLFTWKSPLATSGPSDGKIRFDAALLVSERESSRWLLPFRLGAALSFEQSAVRTFLIPYYAADLGAVYDTVLSMRMFADAGLGLYVLHTRPLSIDVEATYMLPFSAVRELHGAKFQLTFTFAL
jgi:hypothetical protein